MQQEPRVGGENLPGRIANPLIQASSWGSLGFRAEEIAWERHLAQWRGAGKRSLTRQGKFYQKAGPMHADEVVLRQSSWHHFPPPPKKIDRGFAQTPTGKEVKIKR
jgi:hypothetical protein